MMPDVKSCAHILTKTQLCYREMGPRSSGVGAETPSPPPEKQDQTVGAATSESAFMSGDSSLMSTNVTPCTNSPEALDRKLTVSSTTQTESISRKVTCLQSQVPRVSVCDVTTQGAKRPTTLSRSFQSSDSVGPSLEAAFESAGGSDPLVSDEDTCVVIEEWPCGTEALADDQNGSDSVSMDYMRQVSDMSETTHRSDQLSADMRQNLSFSSIPEVEVKSPDSAIFSQDPTDISIKGITPRSDTSFSQDTGVSDNIVETEALTEQTRTNAEIMENIQRAKNFKGKIFLRPNRSSDNLLDECSDSESMTGSQASGIMLDDEQIASLMIESSDFVSFLEQNHWGPSEGRKSMTLPARLSYLQDYMNRAMPNADLSESTEVCCEVSMIGGTEPSGDLSSDVGKETSPVSTSLKADHFTNESLSNDYPYKEEEKEIFV